jgi:hypothetical protein
MYICMSYYLVTYEPFESLTSHFWLSVVLKLRTGITHIFPFVFNSFRRFENLFSYTRFKIGSFIMLDFFCFIFLKHLIDRVFFFVI